MPSYRLLLGIVFILPWQAFADPAEHDFFEKSVRPILVEKCISCHGTKTQKGGLRLDSREAILKGGDDGPAVIVGKPEESLLINAVHHRGELKMPRDEKLSVMQIAALENWVKIGVPWPMSGQTANPKSANAAVEHWSFKPIVKPAIPKSNFANPIDSFIQSSLQKQQLRISPVANRRALIRRLSFDVTGLPPTPEEVAAFEADQSATAYEKVVDRLLASPRYGERSARLWMDIARYADNKGYVFFEDKEYPWAWTYREYLIHAFNSDVPYNRFLLEQLAADQLEGVDGKTLAALGFITIGGHFMGNVHDMIDDRIDTITRGLLGLTVSCARCHDHKFDPVPTADYYSLYGIFRSGTEPMIPPLWDKPGDTEKDRQAAAELAKKEKALNDFVQAKHKELVYQARTNPGEYLLAAYAARNVPPADDFMLIADKGDLNPAMIARWKAFLEATRKSKDNTWALWHRYADSEESQLSRVRTIPSDNPLVAKAFAAPAKSMNEVAQRYHVLLTAVAQAENPPHEAVGLRAALFGPNAPADAPLSLDWGFLSLFPDRATQAEYQKLIKEVETQAIKGPARAMVFVDSERAYDPKIFVRGNPNRLGEAVPRQFLGLLSPNRQAFQQKSGRLELGKAIASDKNPLTARVLVNRIWMQHFGKGLVTTPGDFGVRGELPSHPELLDWLASEFMSGGWSIKKLHRQILTAETYRQASLDQEDGLKADPENRLLWKFPRRRLDFEALHDSVLAVSGSLEATIGGPSVPLLSSRTRRAMYGYVDRLQFPSLLATFDVPNPLASSTERTQTTVAPQALYLMNGPMTRDAARRIIGLPIVKNAAKTSDKIDALYLQILTRRPAPAERDRILAYLSSGPEAERLIDLTQGLLLTNEFTFVD